MNTCCLIITYNRKELLLRCIKKCLEQDVNPDIYIFDNKSTDGSQEYLRDNGIIPDSRITYFVSDRNGGGSYGFSNGLKACIQKGYEFVWMLDDDGYPEEKDCLRKCIEQYELHNDHIVNAMVHDGEFLTFGMLGCNTVKEFREKTGNVLFVSGAASPYNGTLVHKDIVEKIGFPVENFFVSGDEAEYVTRARKYGFKIGTVSDAMYFHPRHIGDRTKIPFTNMYVHQMPYWRIYVRSRNYTYINKKYGGFKGVLKFWIKDMVKCIYQKEHKWKKIKLALSAYSDGYNDRFSIDKVIELMKMK